MFALKPLLILIISLSMFVPYFRPDTFAQDNRSGKSCQVSATKKQLLEKFEKGHYVSNLVIEGNLLIKIMQENIDLEIKIKNATICNGLNFSRFKKQSLKDLELPKTWREEDREQWIKQKQSEDIQKISVLENDITIINTTIEASEKSGYSIYAKGTLFQEVLFRGIIFKGDVNFNHATFKKNTFFNRSIFEGADFKYAVFNERADFGEVIVGRNINFSKASFHKKGAFNAATFGGDLLFNSTNFKDKISFKGTDFGGYVGFESAKIGGDATFLRATFHNKAVFTGSKFHNTVEFKRTMFHQEAIFDHTQFGGKGDEDCSQLSEPTENELSESEPMISFTETRFKENVNFSEAIFKEYLAFESVIFKRGVNFSDSAFCKKTDFRSTSFEESVFGNAYFWGDTLFEKVVFSKESTFDDAYFTGTTRFEDTEFIGTANFESTGFEHGKFDDVTFQGLAYFRNTIFSDSLSIKWTHFKGYIDFRNAEITNLHFGDEDKLMIIPENLDLKESTLIQAKFQDLIFLGDVDFSSAKFKATTEKRRKDTDETTGPPSTEFKSVTFDADVNFLETDFKGPLTFDHVTFKGTVDFTNAKFEESLPLSLSFASFSNLVVTMEQLPAPKFWQEKKEDLSSVFKKFEEQFRNHKQIEDANEAYFQRMEAEHKEEKSNLWILPWRFCCGYGTKFRWIAAWSFLVYVFFALAYYKTGSFVGLTEREIDKDSIFQLNIFVLPKQYLCDTDTDNLSRSARFKAAFMLSLLLMCKVGHRKTRISKRYLMKYFVWFEWAFGYVWFVAMAITLKNTSPVINTILSIF